VARTASRKLFSATPASGCLNFEVSIGATRLRHLALFGPAEETESSLTLELLAVAELGDYIFAKQFDRLHDVLVLEPANLHDA